MATDTEKVASMQSLLADNFCENCGYFCINNEVLAVFTHQSPHMGHQDQDGEKVGQMSLFNQKLEAATDREKQKFIHFQVPLSYLSC